MGLGSNWARGVDGLDQICGFGVDLINKGPNG